jgi:hypothetical protein
MDTPSNIAAQIGSSDNIPAKTTVRTYLRYELNDELDHQFRKGRILSTLDVGYFLDRTLEVYEDEHGDCISAEDFEPFINDICEELLRKKLIYTFGDMISYKENVRSCGLISRQEAMMRKSILAANTGEKNHGIIHRTIFRDTEFPYNPTTGMYIMP